MKYLSIQEVQLMTEGLTVDEKFEILTFLREEGLIENREYSIVEIAALTGTSRQYINKVYVTAMKKLEKLIDIEELQYV